MWIKTLSALYGTVVAILVCFFADAIPLGYQRPDIAHRSIMILTWLGAAVLGILVYFSPRWFKLLLFVPTVYYAVVAIYFLGLALSWN